MATVINWWLFPRYILYVVLIYGISAALLLDIYNYINKRSLSCVDVKLPRCAVLATRRF